MNLAVGGSLQSIWICVCAGGPGMPHVVPVSLRGTARVVETGTGAGHRQVIVVGGQVESSADWTRLTTGDSNASSLRIEGSGRITLDVALVDMNQFFWRKSGSNLYISTDLRLLVEKGMSHDPSAMYSMLQFGAIVPPLSPYKVIRRFTPGRRFFINLQDLSMADEPSPFGQDVGDGPSATEPSISQQAASVVNAIDRTIAKLAPDRSPVVLFSGGVDSGLLAARAAALGWRDTRLVHYSLGPGDPETSVARQMADALGLRLEHVDHEPNAIARLLPRFAQTYPYPFADVSVVPTYALATAVMERFGAPASILDGTGADGCFGLFGKYTDWRRVYQIPRFVRRASSFWYRLKSAWRSDKRSEYHSRVLRRSVQMDLLPASIAQNPLHGIAYHFPAEACQTVHASVKNWVMQAYPEQSEKVRASGLDVMLVCCGIFGQKTHAPLAGKTKIGYPFLNEELARLGLFEASHWPGNDVPKAPLRHALAQQVPGSLVHRVKSGFVPPLKEMFQHPEFIDVFDQAIDSANPVGQWLSRPVMSQMRDALATGLPLASQTYSFAWSVAILSLWLGQVENFAPHPSVQST